MIDSEARHKAAAVLRMFAAREITNDELERRWPSGKDNALEGIRLAIWYVYDDLSEHRHHSDPEADDLLSRCADFLNTNAEHRWPLPRRWLILASRSAASTVALGVERCPHVDPDQTHLQY